MSRKLSDRVSSISTFHDQEVDKPAHGGEELETLNREDKAKLTLNEDVWYDVSRSTKVTVQDRTA